MASRSVGVVGREHAKLLSSLFLALALLLGCAEDEAPAGKIVALEDRESRAFMACVLSKSDAERVVAVRRSERLRYEEYLAKFDFERERDCYAQRWVLPRGVGRLITKAGPGRDQVWLSYPPGYANAAHDPFVRSMAGKDVVARPIAPSLNFADRNSFRKSHYERTDQFVGKYEVWAPKSRSDRSRVLVDTVGGELYALVTLRSPEGRVTSSNVSWIIIKSNLDDRYELDYNLTTKQLGEIEAFDQDIRRLVGGYLVGR